LEREECETVLRRLETRCFIVAEYEASLGNYAAHCSGSEGTIFRLRYDLLAFHSYESAPKKRR